MQIELKLKQNINKMNAIRFYASLKMKQNMHSKQTSTLTNIMRLNLCSMFLFPFVFKVASLSEVGNHERSHNINPDVSKKSSLKFSLSKNESRLQLIANKSRTQLLAAKSTTDEEKMDESRHSLFSRFNVIDLDKDDGSPNPSDSRSEGEAGESMMELIEHTQDAVENSESECSSNFFDEIQHSIVTITGFTSHKTPHKIVFEY